MFWTPRMGHWQWLIMFWITRTQLPTSTPAWETNSWPWLCHQTTSQAWRRIARSTKLGRFPIYRQHLKRWSMPNLTGARRMPISMKRSYLILIEPSNFQISSKPLKTAKTQFKASSSKSSQLTTSQLGTAYQTTTWLRRCKTTTSRTIQPFQTP